MRTPKTNGKDICIGEAEADVVVVVIGVVVVTVSHPAIDRVVVPTPPAQHAVVAFMQVTRSLRRESAEVEENHNGIDTRNSCSM